MKKELKRVFASALAIPLLLGMAACGGNAASKPDAQKTEPAAPASQQEATPKESAATDGEKTKICFITADMANESQAFSSRQFEKFGPDYNFEVTVLDAKGDTQTESTLVNNCIAQGMKAIFLNPNDINAIVPSLMEAKKAGVVVGMFSADLPEASLDTRDFFVGVNDMEAGEAAAQAFMDKFPEGAKIVEIGGQAGHDAQIKRHEGFNKKLEGSKIEVIDYKACQTWSTAEAMSIMEDMIIKEGDQIQGVFCHWDNGATGVLEALNAAGKNALFVVGVDGNKAGYNQVKSGAQSVSISQNFTNMAKKSLEVARAAIDGKPFEKVTFIPLDVVTNANVDSFPVPEW